MTAAITTHVLDLSTGKPARGVAVTLEFRADEGPWEALGRGVTDADGRLRDLLPAAIPLLAGMYRLEFATGAHFAASGVTCFYPSVAITFQVTDPTAHHHVPLLLSPFGYSTYRGS